ncbi:MAG: M23 family metallopeptidase [Flavobacteriales bacterium]|nr:M23 family metallopeptidase [Flavobacteriales bacterium]
MNLARIKEFLTTKMRNRYRLIIRNDSSLEEKITITLTPLNLVLLFSGLLVFFSVIAIFILPATPLRSLMPGGTVTTSAEINKLYKIVDSLEADLEAAERQNRILHQLILGNDSLTQTYNYHSASDNDIFRFASLSNSQSGSMQHQASSASTTTVNHFFTPLKGIVTDTFDRHRNHEAIDITSSSNASVKATLDGTVVLSSWTPETGHVIVLQHTNNFISVYKHNSVLLKQQGAMVNAGEVIAIMGNSGELTSGPHLHFELWNNGQAVNPRDYIKF